VGRTFRVFLPQLPERSDRTRGRVAGRIVGPAMRRLNGSSAHRQAVLRSRNTTSSTAHVRRVRADRCGLFGTSCFETSPVVPRGAAGPASQFVRAPRTHPIDRTHRPWAGCMRFSLPTCGASPSSCRTRPRSGCRAGRSRLSSVTREVAGSNPAVHCT
jgi:hypothetical protein